MDSQAAALELIGMILIVAFLWMVIDRLDNIIALLERDKRKEP